jgi:hypothetical protein
VRPKLTTKSVLDRCVGMVAAAFQPSKLIVNAVPQPSIEDRNDTAVHSDPIHKFWDFSLAGHQQLAQPERR